MLVESRRRRKRSAVMAFTASEIPRWPRRTEPERREPTEREMRVGPSNAEMLSTIRLQRQEEAAPHGVGNQRHVPDSGVRLRTSVAAALPMIVSPQSVRQSTAPQGAMDRRVLLSRASRMHLMIMESLRSTNMRRQRRTELLEEIHRLRTVMRDLEEQIEATARNLAVMDRLVDNFDTVTMAFPIDPSSPTPPSTERRRILYSARSPTTGIAEDEASLIARAQQFRPWIRDEETEEKSEHDKTKPTRHSEQQQPQQHAADGHVVDQ